MLVYQNNVFVCYVGRGLTKKLETCETIYIYLLSLTRCEKKTKNFINIKFRLVTAKIRKLKNEKLSIKYSITELFAAQCLLSLVESAQRDIVYTYVTYYYDNRKYVLPIIKICLCCEFRLFFIFAVNNKITEFNLRL